jgi:broad specificity phosphatase PhoE
MPQTVYLIRHPKVAPEFQGVCYGQLDVPLDDGWETSLQPVIELLSRCQTEARPTMIWHTSLQRTMLPAEYLAGKLGTLWNTESLSIAGSKDIRERDYGTWQGRMWDAIEENEVKQVHDTIYRPDTYRPGGGETTTEMQVRATRWLRTAQAWEHRDIIAFAHSGSIAAIAGALSIKPPSEWESYYMKPSQALALTMLD